MSITTPLSGLRSPSAGLRGSRNVTTLQLVAQAGFNFDEMYSDLDGNTQAQYGEAVARAGGATVLLSPVSDERPVLSQAPSTGVRNELLYSNTFTELSTWTLTNATVEQSDSAYRLADANTGGSNTVIIRQIYTAASGTNTFSIEAKQDQLSQIALRAFGYDTSDTSFFDLADATVVLEGASHSASIEDLGDGWRRASIEFSTTSDLVGVLYVYVVENELSTVPLDGTSSVLIRRAQAEAGTLSNYQETLNEYSVQEEGVRTLEYLYFDGIDDRLSNATFDVGSSSWTVALAASQVSNLAVEFSNASTYLSSNTVSAETNSTLTAPQSHEGVVVVSQLDSLTLVSTESSGYTPTETGAYANTSANLVISGGAQVYSFDLYDAHLAGSSLSRTRDALIFKLGDVQ